MKPTAAPAVFPYPDHRTVAEADAASRADTDEAIAVLDSLSRTRALTLAESIRLERLIRKAAA